MPNPKTKPRQRPTKAALAPRKPRPATPIVGPDRGRVRLAVDSLPEVERHGPFEPYGLYRLNEIHEGLSITPLQARRWLYYDNRLPYVQLTGKGRRFRGRDLNRYINERVVTPDGK